MHIPHLIFRRDDMHGNAYRLAFRQVHLQRAAQLVQPLFGNGIFLRIEVSDIVSKGGADTHALTTALNGKIQMVRQRIGQVGVQAAPQLLPGGIGNVVRRQKDGFRHIPQQVKVLFIHIVKAALDQRQVGKLIGHGRKADALAKHHHLPPLGIPRKCDVIVDLFEKFHRLPAPQKNNLPKAKTYSTIAFQSKLSMQVYK